MSTPKKNKAFPEQSVPNEINATPAQPSSPAKTVQAISANPGNAVKLAVTAKLENGFEYHLNLVPDVVKGIIDPDVPDVYIEIPCTRPDGEAIPNTRRFLHTSMFKEIDVRGLE